METTQTTSIKYMESMESMDMDDLKDMEMQLLVKQALQEDVGPSDITAQLVAADTMAKAQVITRARVVVCGIDVFVEVFNQLDSAVKVIPLCHDGDVLSKNQGMLVLEGPARSLLTGERVALNFLQMLSGTATTTQAYVDHLAQSTPQGMVSPKLLDTRKCISGYRHLQKYAVRCGGGMNHRMGLYDAFLIKENHIKACGSILSAVTKAREIAHSCLCEVEVENLTELQEALNAQVDRVMLDNFKLEDIEQAVRMNQAHQHTAELEISGNVDLEHLSLYAKTGVDYISVGALTKHIQAIDLSMRIV